VSSRPPGDAASVLLTGGTSYLGLALAGRLTAAGHRVTAVVRPGSDVARLQRLDPPPRVVVHDGDTVSLVEAVAAARPDVVAHLASAYRREHSVADVEPLVVSNILFGTQLLEAMHRAGCRRIVAAGTYFQHFDTDGYRPLNLYAATKQAFEDVLTYYVDAHRLEATTLVLYDVYGPGDDRPKLMNAIRKALVGGEPVSLADRAVEIDAVFVDDAVAALETAVGLLDHGALPGTHRFAVSSQERCTLSELVSTFEEVAGRSVPVVWGGYPTPERSIVIPWTGPPLPGWEPRWSMRDGIRRFLAAP
jgi:nucleoside-diphosphate-sugar epimerase